MWLYLFIDWLKFETRPSSLRNSGMANSPSLIWEKSFLSCSYFGNVTFTEGWCHDSKAISFSKVGSYATVSNVNIAVCDFTIVCWIRLLKPITSDIYEQTIIMGSSITGKLLSFGVVYNAFAVHLEISRELSVDIISSTYVVLTVADINRWNHVAVTCDKDNKVRVFFNGELGLTAFSELVPIGDFLQGIKRPPKKTYRIGNFLWDNRTVSQLYGSVMDLHILGFALPPDKISYFYRG